MWRTFLAANQWCDIQTQRQLNATMILIVLIVLLDGANLKFLATPQPDGDDLTPDALNPALRFANTTTWWLVLATGYWLWTWAVRDRFITEPPHEMLVDLCTMAKVSVFILDAQHHGYYLHCRSPYQHADGDMVELADQLRKEEMQQLTGRGLKVRRGRGWLLHPQGMHSPLPPHSYPPYCSLSLPAARLPRRRADVRNVLVPRLAQPLRQDLPRAAPAGARQAVQPGRDGHGPPPPQQRGQRATRRVQGAETGCRSAAPPPALTTDALVSVAQTAPAALLRASHRLRSFLKSFVNQTDPNYPMEYRPQTALGRSLRVPPEGSVPGTTVMLAGACGAPLLAGACSSLTPQCPSTLPRQTRGACRTLPARCSMAWRTTFSF